MTLFLAVASSLLVFLLLGLTIYFLPLRLEFAYQRQGNQESALASVSLAGRVPYASQLLPPPKKHPKTSQGSPPSGAQGFSGSLRSAVRTALRIERAWRLTISRMANSARFETIEWTSTIGLKDAASTALCTGSLWAIKGCFVGKCQQQLGHAASQIKIKVSPDFQTPQSQTQFNCIAELRCGHIIKATRPLFNEFIENRGEL